MPSCMHCQIARITFIDGLVRGNLREHLETFLHQVVLDDSQGLVLLHRLAGDWAFILIAVFKAITVTNSAKVGIHLRRASRDHKGDPALALHELRQVLEPRLLQSGLHDLEALLHQNVVRRGDLRPSRDPLPSNTHHGRGR